MARSAIFLADVAAALDGLDVREAALEARILGLLGIQPTVEEVRAIEQTLLSPAADSIVANQEAPRETHVSQSYRYIPSVVQSASLETAAAPAIRSQRAGPRIETGTSERDE